jgi:hypothetical protein
MNNEDTEQVMLRIANAISRIEAAAARPSQAADTPEAGALAALQARHDTLRNETNAALIALDAVIHRAKAGGSA